MTRDHLLGYPPVSLAPEKEDWTYEYRWQLGTPRRAFEASDSLAAKLEAAKSADISAFNLRIGKYEDWTKEEDRETPKTKLVETIRISSKTVSTSANQPPFPWARKASEDAHPIKVGDLVRYNKWKSDRYYRVLAVKPGAIILETKYGPASYTYCTPSNWIPKPEAEMPF